MLLNMFRRSKPQSASDLTIGCRGNSSEEEEESSALIAQSTRFTVSETYVVPDINGHFPTDLSDSDDDFFEKNCPVCEEALVGAKECEKCTSSGKRKAKEPSSNDKQTETKTQRRTKHSDKSCSTTRTTKTYTQEELETAKQLQKISLELQKSAPTDT